MINVEDKYRDLKLISKIIIVKLIHKQSDFILYSVFSFVGKCTSISRYINISKNK